jgi:hypothetical protein
MSVLVPINPDIDEAEYVAHEDGPQRDQRLEIGFVRDFEFQHHDDGDDDAVTELQAFLSIGFFV